MLTAVLLALDGGRRVTKVNQWSETYEVDTIKKALPVQPIPEERNSVRSIVFTKPFSLVFTTAWYSADNRFPSIRTCPVGVVVHAIVHVGATLCNSAKSTATTRRHEGQQQEHSDDALHHFEMLFYDMFCVLKHKEHYHLHKNGRISWL